MGDLSIGVVQTKLVTNFDVEQTVSTHYREQERLYTFEKWQRKKAVRARAVNLSKKHPDEIIAFTISIYGSSIVQYFKGGKEIEAAEVQPQPLRYIYAFLNTVPPDKLEHIANREWVIEFATSSKLAIERKVAPSKLQYRIGIIMIGDMQTGEFRYWKTQIGCRAVEATNYAINEWNQERERFNAKTGDRLSLNAICRRLSPYEYETLTRFAQTLNDLDHDFTAITKDAGEHTAIMEQLALQMEAMNIAFQQYLRQRNS